MGEVVLQERFWAPWLGQRGPGDAGQHPMPSSPHCWQNREELQNAFGLAAGGIAEVGQAKGCKGVEQQGWSMSPQMGSL